jgi:hypothetical protein
VLAVIDDTFYNKKKLNTEVGLISPTLLVRCEGMIRPVETFGWTSVIFWQRVATIFWVLCFPGQLPPPPPTHAFLLPDTQHSRNHPSSWFNPRKLQEDRHWQTLTVPKWHLVETISTTGGGWGLIRLVLLAAPSVVEKFSYSRKSYNVCIHRYDRTRYLLDEYLKCIIFAPSYSSEFLYIKYASYQTHLHLLTPRLMITPANQMRITTRILNVNTHIHIHVSYPSFSIQK